MDILVNGSLQVTYSTDNGPVTFVDATFGSTGGSYFFAFEGTTDPTKPYNDVHYSWSNYIAASELIAPLGEQSALTWEYNVSY